eukprot:CCRYP_019998-RA/>CCRYP_019998-RA protein AED:0.31 eAED:0.47 QI:0/0/0/1/0/0/5/0/276
MDGELNQYDPSEFGSHSARKGVASWVAGGCAVSLPIVLLCLRAGWSLGGVKDKYLFHENARDQYVRRRGEAGEERTIKQWLKKGDYLGTQLIRHGTVLYLFVYHYNHLKTNFHPNCILRNSLPFKEIPDDFKSFATRAYPWTKTSYTPSFTGIPPHVIQLTKLRELKLKIDSLKEGVLNEIKDEMEKRGFALSEFNTHTVTSRIDAVGEMSGGWQISKWQPIFELQEEKTHYGMPPWHVDSTARRLGVSSYDLHTTHTKLVHWKQNRKLTTFCRFE